jgi:ketosteroid isomerase-like protein
MRKLMIGCAIGVMVVSLAACTGSGASSETDQELQDTADRWEIDQIEKNFHEATTKKDIDLMLSLWAPNATMTIGPGQTAVGKDEIRRFWIEESPAFMPVTHWVSDHPAYKLEITVNGDRGTLHFECHYVDYDSAKLAATTVADLDVARIDGRWLITNMVAGSTTLAP